MSQDLSQFIQPGRVHRQIYTDPAIFELELERISASPGFTLAMKAR
jgi:phenylpropionate dioxygenase-like ring-hydroxylating dioxygenase large terminal subunit